MPRFDRAGRLSRLGGSGPGPGAIGRRAKYPRGTGEKHEGILEARSRTASVRAFEPAITPENFTELMALSSTHPDDLGLPRAECRERTMAGLGHVTAQTLRRLATATAHAQVPVVVAAAMIGHPGRLLRARRTPYRDAP